ncbi:porin family protein [Phyllobacterium sp. 21LDTY02-6]|jgi:outer membrane immunogenic protein|uniref:outer membrane protein n=1 Tax=unclassified Phyllobacterium TaxID=2638441 RepID=UPI0020208C97|nr:MULTISPECIES: outer membrane protein [unclassified Phyllobacterium]MCO4318299.1 porin family protein [Phyllobacterium sp. 21LDTY02-6]MCX8280294.1 porin family protein [Phyllobacterium sp. 0TCS1.6C]MCX8294145.1 porin family protein [Phyllobacterium sp. 0TCS1.6A]
MRNISAIGLFFSALALSGSALAADAVIETAPEAVLADPGFSWTGFYAGVNAGYGFGGDDEVGVRSGGVYLGNIGTIEQSGFIGGGQIGYNYQINNWVIGLEADFQGAGLEDSTAGSVDGIGVEAESSIDWFGTLRPRVGYAWDRTLIYGTGGLAYGRVNYKAAVEGDTFLDQDKTRAGWVAGAGIEHAFTDHLTAKLEYQYVNFGKYTVSEDGFSTEATPDFHSVRVGLNYKF